MSCSLVLSLCPSPLITCSTLVMSADLSSLFRKKKVVKPVNAPAPVVAEPTPEVAEVKDKYDCKFLDAAVVKYDCKFSGRPMGSWCP